MSVVYSAALKTTRMDAVLTALDAAGSPGGYIEIGTSGGFSGSNLLATIHFAETAGTVSGSVLTFSCPIEDASAANSGTATQAQVFDGAGGTAVITGLTVGTSGTDIVLSSVTIVAGEPVTLTAGSITHG
jgi:hypothetical protein